VDEIPLDVCKLCIDAWKTSAEIQTLTGADILSPTIMVPTGPQALQMIPGAPSRQPVHEPLSEPKIEPLMLVPNIGEDAESKEIQDRLYNLDNDFINDRITADEYVAQRRQVVNQLVEQKDSKKPTLLSKATSDGYLSPEDSMPAGPPHDEFKLIDFDKHGELLKGYDRLLSLLIIEKKRGKINITKYPKDWKPPSSLNRVNLESVYDLYDELREDQEKILLQFNDTKLGVLGKKDNRILCMVLEGDEKIEDYIDEIDQLTDMFETTSNSEEFQKALPSITKKTKDLSFN
jgi:hypothetical protein